MFNAIWKMKEGFATGAGLILVGLVLQYSVGPIHWSDFAFPINGIFLILYLLTLVVVYLLRHRVRLFAFLFTAEAAVPTLIYAALLTVVMGLTRQVAPHERAIDPIGLTQMLSFWPFVFIYARLAGNRGADRTTADLTFPPEGSPLHALTHRALHSYRLRYAR